MPREWTLRRTALEGATILGSILLAFAIDAWWDGLKALRLEATMVWAVIDEVEANRRGLETAVAGSAEQLAVVDRFVRSTPLELAQIPSDSVRQFLTLSRASEHEPIQGAAMSLLQTPALNAAGLEARSLVSHWVQALGGVGLGRNALQMRQDAVQHELAAHIARYGNRYSGDGAQFVDLIVATFDPSERAELRRDPVLMAAIFEKGHRQIAYSGELRSLLALSDSVINGLRTAMPRPR